MIDHLISFPTEADAKAHPALSRWLSAGEWNRSMTFPDVRLVVSAEPYACFPGWWIVVTTEGEGPDAELAAIEPCRMVANREAAQAGEPFVYSGLRADPAQIAQIVRIDGLPAGSSYPFSDLRVIG